MIRDKGKDEPFVGFYRPESNWWKMPNIMIDVLAYLDNASEIKVILYLLRHTWGYSEYEQFKHITIDEFQHGRWCTNPQSGQLERMDSGTGLCEQSVRNGLKAAIKHGFIETVVDDHDRARIEKAYRLKMQPAAQRAAPTSSAVEVQSLDPGVQTLDPRGLNFRPRTSNRKTLKKDTSKKDRDDSKGLSPLVSFSAEDAAGARIAGTVEATEEVPAWLTGYIADFSAEFHDMEHESSNLTRCARLYWKSGLDQEAFVTLLYQARQQTQQATRIRKRNADGSRNKMPYWFTCLERLLTPPT
jgi:hypothetical protein